MISLKYLLLCSTLLVVAGCGSEPVPPDSAPIPTASASVPETPKPAYRETDLDRVGRFISGLPQTSESPYAKLEENRSWKEYSAEFGKTWGGLSKERLVPMRQWSDKHLRPVPSVPEKLFYPFSGPDFVHAFTFFGDVGEMVMVGLEPPGSIPTFESLSADTNSVYLRKISHALFTSIHYSFFRNRSMEKDLYDPQLNGVLPLVVLFMSRTGCRLVDIQYLTVGGDGVLARSQAVPPAGAARGFEVRFLSERGDSPRTVRYFSADLSNPGLKNSPGFLEYIRSFRPCATYLKAASYLMFYERFSTIRGEILANSRLVLQDDSGIPLRFFDEAGWQRSLYGKYTAPLPMFSFAFQSDLRAAYAVGGGAVSPLNFGIGYLFRNNQSNLMMFVRDEARTP